MLHHLSIQNYALIEKIEIDFPEGLSIITGETGAGKSILLGALSLIAGNRADSGVLQDKTKKCIVEGVFDIKNYSLKYFLLRTNSIMPSKLLSAGSFSRWKIARLYQRYACCSFQTSGTIS